MLIVHSDTDWILPFLPKRFKLRQFPALTNTSTGFLAARCFWNGSNTAMDEIHSLAQRYDHVVIYMCEPWTRHDDTDFLPTVLRESPSNVMAFADVLMDDDHDNYRQISNWFMVHENFYQDTQWGKHLLSRLRHDYDIKQYRFDALLGVARPSKKAVYQHYLQSAYRDQIMLTYHKSDARQGVWDVPYVSTPVSWNESDDALDDSCLKYTLWTDMPAPNGAVHRVGTQHIIPVSIFNSCWYSIIAEGFMDDRGTRLTEKTAKALLSQRLFVYFGAVNDLRRLRSLGFRTFDAVIDETYDSIEDNDERWAQAWQQVEYLCAQDPVKIQTATRYIREHNQRVFLETDWFAALRSHLKSCVDKYL